MAEFKSSSSNSNKEVEGVEQSGIVKLKTITHTRTHTNTNKYMRVHTNKQAFIRIHIIEEWNGLSSARAHMKTKMITEEATDECRKISGQWA